MLDSGTSLHACFHVLLLFQLVKHLVVLRFLRNFQSPLQHLMSFKRLVLCSLELLHHYNLSVFEVLLLLDSILKVKLVLQICLLMLLINLLQHLRLVAVGILVR